MRIVWIVVRVAVAVAIFAAVVAQLQRTVSNAIETQQTVAHVVVNFVSFFTIDSNLIAAVTAVIGAVLLARLRSAARAGAAEPAWFAVLRLCAVTYMTTTGLVYNALLRGIQLPQGTTVEWANEVLHVIGPLVVLLDWLLAPDRRAVSWRALLTVVVFPLVWVGYTLIRGPVVGWYPYPFLDPATFGGNGGPVAGYVVGIAVLIVGLAALAVLVARRLSGRADASARRRAAG